MCKINKGSKQQIKISSRLREEKTALKQPITDNPPLNKPGGCDFD